MPSRHDTLRMILKSSAAAIGALVVANVPVLANPLDGHVASGLASIANAANATTVKQSSEGVVIDWSSFDIGKGQTTTFAQPNAQAIAINRIGGNSASQIFGTLDANGRIVLINGNGLLFGKGSQVNVGSLVATSTNAGNKNALAGKFNKSGSASASIVNDGKITANQGGLVALVAPNVTNNGTVNAKLGTVALGGADKFTVDINGDGLVSFAAHGTNPGQVTNSGVLKGATVTLTARSAEGLASGVVSTGGVIEANAAHGLGGAITLDAGKGGSVDLSGALDASGKLGGGSISNNEATANLTVESGASITADATQSGNGDKISLTADNTNFAGHISAKGSGANGIGGNAEVSGHGALSFTGLANLTAANGKAGTLTLDPSDYFITADGTSPEPNASAISATALEIELANANVELVTRSGGSQAGDFTVATNVSWSSPYKLVLKAYRNVVIDNGVTISSTGGGSIYLFADRKGTGTGAVSFEGTGSLDVSGGGGAYIFYDPTDYDHPTDYSGAVSVTGGKDVAYEWVNDLTDLQAIGADTTTLAGTYYLRASIDASATAAWNSDEGFMPIGSASTPFAGVFNGAKSSITDLTIDMASANEVGLFGESSGLIEGVHLVGGAITGGFEVGALVGENDGEVMSSSASATVNGQEDVGGLVGYQNAPSALTDKSFATGDVHGQLGDVGGLVGHNAAGRILYSYATGNAGPTTGTQFAEVVGGLVGENDSGGIIERSYATGIISAGSDAGGFAGSNSGLIENAYAVGNTSTFNDQSSGAFVGATDRGKILDSYALGNSTTGGAFVGSDAFGIFANDYWDTSANSGISQSGGGISGLSATQLQSGLPTGFGSTIWGSDSSINGGYPYLLRLPPT